MRRLFDSRLNPPQQVIKTFYLDVMRSGTGWAVAVAGALTVLHAGIVSWGLLRVLQLEFAQPTESEAAGLLTANAEKKGGGFSLRLRTDSSNIDFSCAGPGWKVSAGCFVHGAPFSNRPAVVKWIEIPTGIVHAKALRPYHIEVDGQVALEGAPKLLTSSELNLQVTAMLLALAGYALMWSGIYVYVRTLSRKAFK